MKNRRRKLTIGIPLLLVASIGVAAYFLAPGEIRTADPPYWHVMGDRAHMSFRIKLEGRDTYRLDVWLPAGMGAPQSIAVQVHRSDQPAEINTIPFEFVSGGPDPYGYEGFDKYTYNSKGQSSLDEGEWNYSIVIKDKSDAVHKYEKQVVIS